MSRLNSDTFLLTQGNVNTNIGGYALDNTILTTNNKLDSLSNTVFNKTLNKETSSIDISGQTVNIDGGEITINNILETPLITGFALETTLGTTNNKLDTLNTTLTNKVLNKTTSSIDISGQTVAISNTGFNSSNIAQTPLITGFALESTLGTANNKLDTLNTTITNKHLDKTTDSVDITNQNVNVNMTVEGSAYDLLLQGSTLWADSRPLVNPFVADLLGREGWWYTNQGNVANKSNIYWYANPPTGAPSGFQENDMTFSQLSGFYSVLTCDYVDNGSLTIPIFSVYSQPTGTNDILPTFAHSSWAYQLSSVDLAKFRKGETVLLYSGSTRPNVFNQLPSYQLQLASANGDALPTEIVAYMSVNTQATTSTIAYLLQYVGYLNSAVGHIKQYGFKNSKERLAQENLASLTVVDGVLSVSGSGGSSSSVIQGISTTSGVAVDINATPSGVGINRLLVSSFIDDGTNNLSINNDGSITAISLVTAKDADNAGDNMDIFAKGNRLYTDTQITNGGNTLAVNDDFSIDTHCFGSSDGTTFHHLKTTATGNLIVEAKCHDGSNNGITSSVVSTKRGLDVNIISGGGSGGGGVIQGIDSTSGLAVDIKATVQRLLVDSNIVDASTPARKLIINGDGSINVVGTTGGGSIEGTFNNIHSGDLTASTFSTALNINNLYGNESVISYEDTTSLTSFISIHGSFDNTNYFYIGVLQPAIIRTGTRQASSVLKLKGLKYIKIYNESTTTTATGVKCTLFSG